MAKTFAVLHTKKLKTTGEIGGLGKHNERERDTPNADPERTTLNERLAGSGDWVADVQERLDTQERIRKNAVLAVSHLLSASRDWFEGRARRKSRPGATGAWRGCARPTAWRTSWRPCCTATRPLCIFRPWSCPSTSAAS